MGVNNIQVIFITVNIDHGSYPSQVCIFVQGICLQNI